MELLTVKNKHSPKRSYIGTGNPFFGKHHSQETKIKMVKAHTGKTFTEEHRRNMSISFTGRQSAFLSKCHTEEAKQANREAHLGKCWTTEQKRRVAGKFAGANNPRWLGGISFEPYSMEFNDILKEAVRVRDGYTCQLCGQRQNGKAYHVHHIDYNKKNNDQANLITLCKPDHTRTNANRDFYCLLFSQMPRVRLLAITSGGIPNCKCNY